MADLEAVARQFVESYYQTFHSNRAGLTAFYLDTSMLTFESEASLGVSSIIEKLVTGLPFQKVQHRVVTIDAQPSPQQGGVLVYSDRCLDCR